MNALAVEFTTFINFRRTANWSIKIAVAIALTFGLWFLAIPASEAHAQDVIYHSVRPGESLSRIANAYGVSVSTILQNNSIANPNVLRVGQILVIPRTTRPPAPQPTARPIEPAPTRPPAQPTSRPAPQEPTPRPTVAPEIQPTAVPRVTQEPGRPIPTPTPYVSTVRYYTVRPGDTLYGIAARFGVSVPAIRSRNRLAGSIIYPGQSLAIP